MTNNRESVDEFVRKMAGDTQTKLRPMTVAELERNIKTAELYISQLEGRVPPDPELSSLYEVLNLLQMARGKGRVL